MTIKHSIVSAAIGFASVCAPATMWAEINDKPFTVPELRDWKGGEGRFIPSASSRIVYSGKDTDIDRVAKMLHQDWTTFGGTGLTPAPGAKAATGDVRLVLKPSKKGNQEKYSLDINKNGVTITAPTADALYWATRTLLQIAEQSDDMSLPFGSATDYPEYSFRGFMIDCGRKYIPMDYLYALVDAMAYYKMNVLHIHLNDNGFKYYFDDDWDKTQAAFRMESETYPELTARDGSYSKQEFRDLIAYAADHGVEIIPEFDFPAHSLSFTRLKPELASTGANGRDHLDITNPQTYEFLDNLLKEYIGGPDPVFSGKRFHIGTDEYQGDSLTMEQFRGFTDRYIRYTEDFDKQACIWGSLTHAKGQTPVKVDNVLMYMWSNMYADPKQMAKLGYKMVSIPDGYVYIVPSAGYYYDYLNTKYLYENWTPANIGNVKFEGDTLKLVEGGAFAVWNDHPNNGLTVKDIHHRVMDALPTMAAKTWDGENVTTPYDEFRSRSLTLSEAPGRNYLGRYGSEPGTIVLEQAVVAPGSTMPIPEIGYDYTVEFDITGAPESLGTKLFESPAATFWI
ncbi:MAG: family 20 glycosylhydrolase, partial [Muribaculaceae bacterium]|nr:family 20 glycosylhydrolase [Muribaculaceae bacterium]